MCEIEVKDQEPCTNNANKRTSSKSSTAMSNSSQSILYADPRNIEQEVLAILSMPHTSGKLRDPSLQNNVLPRQINTDNNVFELSSDLDFSRSSISKDNDSLRNRHHFDPDERLAMSARERKG